MQKFGGQVFNLDQIDSVTPSWVTPMAPFLSFMTGRVKTAKLQHHFCRSRRAGKKLSKDQVDQLTSKLSDQTNREN